MTWYVGLLSGHAREVNGKAAGMSDRYLPAASAAYRSPDPRKYELVSHIPELRRTLHSVNPEARNHRLFPFSVKIAPSTVQLCSSDTPSNRKVPVELYSPTSINKRTDHRFRPPPSTTSRPLDSRETKRLPPQWLQPKSPKPPNPPSPSLPVSLLSSSQESTPSDTNPP